MTFNAGDFVFIEVPAKLRVIVKLKEAWDGGRDLNFTSIFNVQLVQTPAGLTPKLTPVSDTLELEKDGILSIPRDGEAVIFSKVAEGSGMYNELIEQTTGITLGVVSVSTPQKSPLM